MSYQIVVGIGAHWHAKSNKWANLNNTFLSHMSHTFPKEMPETPWAQGGPRSDTRDLWRQRWEGPSDPRVGEGPGRWERLPPTVTRSHEGKAISYA
jgi:hypothetical protein